ncbi:methyl-accepting chemotaxis protein, partial [Enterobacter sichuanensis]
TLFSVAAGSLIGWVIVRAINRAVAAGVNFCKPLSDRDMTATKTPHRQDENGLLVQALIEMN